MYLDFQEIEKIIPALQKMNVEIKGIQWDCISCSDYILIQQAHGLEFYTNRSQLERQLVHAHTNPLNTYVKLQDGKNIYKLIR